MNVATALENSEFSIYLCSDVCGERHEEFSVCQMRSQDREKAENG